MDILGREMLPSLLLGIRENLLLLLLLLLLLSDQLSIAKEFSEAMEGGERFEQFGVTRGGI